MLTQNFLFIDSYATTNEELDRFERKQRKVINILKRNLKTVNDNKAKVAMTQKSVKLKQSKRDYTFKLPEPNKRLPQRDNIVFNHGWKVRNESEISADAKQKMQRRSQMILVGNVYSMKNKSFTSSNIFPRIKTIDEIKKEIIVKSRDLGNQYSRRFMKSREASTIFVGDFNRYHRLLCSKKRMEQDYYNFCDRKQNIPESFSLKYSNVIDEICQVEKTLNIKNQRRNVCWSILSLIPQRRDEILRILKTPCTHQEAFVRSDDEKFCGVFDIETLNQACSEVNAHQYESNYLDSSESIEPKNNSLLCVVTRDNLSSQLTESRKSLLERIDESDGETSELNVENSTQVEIHCDSSTFDTELSEKLEDFQQFFPELEEHSVESVKSRSKLSTQSVVSAMPSKAIRSFVVRGIFGSLHEALMERSKRRQEASSTISLSDDKNETEVSSRKIDDNKGKLYDISTSVPSKSSKQLQQVSSLIDDVSASAFVPTRASDANLALMQEISFDNKTMPTNNDDKRKEKFELSHESHETFHSMTWQSSNPSLDKLRSSTFTSKKDIFEKSMEIRRKRIGDDDSNVKTKLKNSSSLLDDGCISNEQVRQVINFIEE